jgi:hypothetical protein
VAAPQTLRTPRTVRLDRLIASIETQNEITAMELDLNAVMSLVVARARTLTAAGAAAEAPAKALSQIHRGERDVAAARRAAAACAQYVNTRDEGSSWIRGAATGHDGAAPFITM